MGHGRSEADPILGKLCGRWFGRHWPRSKRVYATEDHRCNGLTAPVAYWPLTETWVRKGAGLAVARLQFDLTLGIKEAFAMSNLSIFPTHARNFEFFPTFGGAYRCLAQFLSGLSQIDFISQISDYSKNSGQMTSNFDDAFKKSLVRLGASDSQLKIPPLIRQKHDFGFSIDNRNIAVEVEKTNREKILRDILKCHMYMKFGFDFCLIVLPKNYPHTHGMWNLYETGVERLQECMDYDFGVSDKLERILLMGFETFDTRTGEPHSVQIRNAMRIEAAG